MNSTDHGRFDLFGMDKFTAEKDRDRKRLQAQMLAEQIQEQRERKEEEFRRKRDEEMREERRLARELREIEERHRHEQAVLSGQADAQSEPTPKVPPGRGHGTGQVRRRKSSKDLACESPAGAVATPNSVQIVPQVLGWMEMSVAGAGPVDVGERWSLMA